MSETEQLIVDVFTESMQIHTKAPVYWKDPHGYQVWARARSLFKICGGVRLASSDTSDAGRKQFSRLRQRLETEGLIRLTYVGPTSMHACLTTAGLAMAEQLTGKRAPKDLRQATKELEGQE